MRKWITEGEIKASIATDILGEDVLSMPGTSMWRIATDAVMELDRVQEIVVAMDADYRRKAGVARALACIAADLLDRTQNGPTAISLGEWPEHLGKGLDDFLSANPGLKPTLRPITREVVAELQDLADRLAQEDADRRLAAGKMPVAADVKDDDVLAGMVAAQFDEAAGGKLAPAAAEQEMREIARGHLRSLSVMKVQDLLLDDAARLRLLSARRTMGGEELRRVHIHNATADLVGEIDRMLENDQSGSERHALAGYLRYDRSEVGFAQRMADRYRNRVMYVRSLGWHVWDGTVWVKDADKIHVSALVQQMTLDIEAEIRVARICASAGVLGPSVNADAISEFTATDVAMQNKAALGAAAMQEEEDHSNWVARCRTDHFIRSVISLLRGRVWVDDKKVDTYPHLLNTKVGVVDLRDGSIAPHDPGLLLTQITACGCDPAAPRTMWENFLSEALAEKDGSLDPEYMRYFKTLLGYALWGKASEQKLFSVWGEGANGKGVLFDTVRDLMGSYGRTIDPGLLIKSMDNEGGSGRARVDIVNLRAARIIVASEPDRGQSMAEGLVKRFSGKDKVSVRLNHSNEMVDFDIVATIFMMCNSLLRIAGTDRGIWRRQEVLEFLHQRRMPGDTDPKLAHLPLADLDLHEKLMESEGDGIMGWLVEGAIQWHREGLIRPPRVTEATKEYRGEQDRVLQFLTERVEIEDRRGNVVSQAEMYEAYTDWCKAAGTQPMARDRLKGALKDHHIEDSRNGPIGMIWKGVRLRPAPAQPYRGGQAGGGWNGRGQDSGWRGSWDQEQPPQPTRALL